MDEVSKDFGENHADMVQLSCIGWPSQVMNLFNFLSDDRIRLHLPESDL